MHMLLSIREKFTNDDDAWGNYYDFIKLPSLKEVRTIDSNLNFPLSTPIFIETRKELIDAILDHPTFDSTSQYVQIAINCSQGSFPDLSGLSLALLGYDLSDRTQVSSILNCGQWTGELIPFVNRLNNFGLLSYDDAVNVQKILPNAWNDDPHSFVDIWAIYELKQ